MKSKLCAVLLMVFVLAGTCLAKQDSTSDDMVYNNVRIKLASDAVVKGGGIQVDVKEGVVTLGGAVELPNQKERAEKLAKKVKGVKQVINNITIRK
ncbi:MAG TPA: BON domain-containing protein [Bryobacteraceae bacterium]|nr:BON domain-containing protein [Bryobacteraceae bacterium]